MSALDEYAAAVVGRMPDPPRDVPTLVLIRRVYGMGGAPWVAGFGLATALFTICLAVFRVSGPIWAQITLFGILSVVSIVFMAAPAIGAIRLARALRWGIKVEGEILKAAWSRSELRPPTIEAGTNGMAVGTRRVFHPAGTFDERYESDSTWARDLGNGGVRVMLLADPSSGRVHFDLGPAERPAEVGGDEA